MPPRLDGPHNGGRSRQAHQMLLSPKDPESAREGPMPSFDIVSKTDLAEVDNALANMTREMSQRYDFKNSQSKIERKEAEITISADDDLKLKQMHELLQGHLARRKIDAGAIDYKPVEKAAGQAVRQKAMVRQGIDRDLAKRLVKEVKDGKFKVQIAVQGDELRVTGKKRDDLQAVIQHLKGLNVEQPLQYVNFRD
ncbi:MAG: YajQ family cyclic di-GMP-binding protein, partial [Hyphomicrobiales bacterium]